MYVLIKNKAATFSLQIYKYIYKSLTPARIRFGTSPDLTRWGTVIDNVLNGHGRVAGFDVMEGGTLDLLSRIGLADDGGSAGNFGAGAAPEEKEGLGVRMTTLGVYIMCIHEALLAGKSKAGDDGSLVEGKGGIIGDGLVLGKHRGTGGRRKGRRNENEGREEG